MQRPAGDIRPPEAGAASGERVWMNRWRSWRLAAIYREETRTGPGGWILRDSRRVDAQLCGRLPLRSRPRCQTTRHAQVMTLQGRTEVVTGGTSGIGRAITARLLREGVSVAICGRSSAAVAKVVTDLDRSGTGKICGTPVDVSNSDDVHRLFAFADVELGGVDILVNNAGVAILHSVAEMEPGDWLRSIDTNLSATFYCCWEALIQFRQRGAGFIINTGSLLGKNAVAGGATYCASKFGLNGFSEAMLLNHRQENVWV